MNKDSLAIVCIIAIVIFVYSRELQLDKRPPSFIKDYEKQKNRKKMEQSRLQVARRLNNPFILRDKNLPNANDILSPNLPEPTNFRPRWTFPETVPSDYLSIVSKRPYIRMNPPFANY